MKNKSKDELYCGVRKKKIQKACPELNLKSLEMFIWYISERYQIHIKKDILNKKPPFTSDSILKEYRFTNIRREHDRETKWLIQNIAHNDFLTYRQRLLNCVLFRIYNKHESMEIIGAPFKLEGIWHITEAKNRIKAFQQSHPRYVWYTNAFMTSGTKRVMGLSYPKEPNTAVLPLRLLKTLNESTFFKDIKTCKNQAEVYELLKNTNAIGEFLAYQIYVDFTYIEEFPFSENEFTVAGLGCRKGIDYLFRDKDGLTYEECLFWLRDNWDRIPDLYELDNWFDPKEKMLDLKHYDRVMNVMCLENCFCEFSKYYRACTDTGRPRNKYKFDVNKKLI